MGPGMKKPLILVGGEIGGHKRENGVGLSTSKRSKNSGGNFEGGREQKHWRVSAGIGALKGACKVRGRGVWQ